MHELSGPLGVALVVQVCRSHYEIEILNQIIMSEPWDGVKKEIYTIKQI